MEENREEKTEEALDQMDFGKVKFKAFREDLLKNGSGEASLGTEENSSDPFEEESGEEVTPYGPISFSFPETEDLSVKFDAGKEEEPAEEAEPETTEPVEEEPAEKVPEEEMQEKPVNEPVETTAEEAVTAAEEVKEQTAKEPEEQVSGEAAEEEAETEETSAEAEKKDEEDLGPEPEPYVEPDIRDLYYDYTEKLSGIEENRYFRYLYEMVKAGENSFQQTNQILHKVVDEKWLDTIEGSLDALNRIVANPRKFIKTEEEIVPVGLAKKITAESVKHLSRNTQFIESEPDEPIQPSKVLNSSLQETYDLYENRFIYHLIQRLVRFIDKRTDVIFWATGDEKQNHLKFESKVDDAYEQIEYKLEMTIKNLTSFAENDADHMEVFARIDRLRRLVMSIRSSSFCSIMSGCAAVRSPIQRTNLMIKDPDYRTCYKLWHFLEDYDDVGYNIEVIDEAMAFDEEYVSQMYTNMVGGYTVFKSLMEEEDRVLNDELIEKQKLASQSKDLTPKFITELKEIRVDSPDIEDVEVRRVFVEEVTEAQLEAERKAEEADQARLAAEAETEEARRETKEARQMQEEAERKVLEAEKRKEDAEEKTREAIADAQAAERERRESVARAREEVNKAKNDCDLKILEAQEKARDDAAYQISLFRVQSEENVKKIKEASAHEIEAAKEAADTEIRESKARADEAETLLAESRKEQEATARALRTKEEAYNALSEDHEESLEEIDSLKKNLAFIEERRRTEGSVSLKKNAALAGSLKQAESLLEEALRIRKENEYQIRVLKQQLEVLKEEKAALSANSKALGKRGTRRKW